ncbi:SGNH/GDSL hydrolase family protein [Pedobacter arcticus]|uniref:SGNH/GDSL hydrolase family protein n=1 Tax=Pedobacter arcticus TaxID=752140 RepID=UPI00036B41B5|nr:SGNH/GDSL hydrolase family protein [Pedobacter arcticus]
MNKYCILLFVLLTSSQIFAQDGFKYTDGHLLNLRGSSFASEDDYNRLDSVQRLPLPARVQELAQNSSGLTINFETNAKSIRVKWELEKLLTIWNMTPVAINGLDLYAFENNKWQYVASARPTGEKNRVLMVDQLDGRSRKYRLHLPLYSKLNKLEVGVPDSSTIKAWTQSFTDKRKVVIYGSSITQGASASRPGMAYPSIISRKMGLEVINLGFSGSGKMEFDMAKTLAKIPAAVYVLDCVPNPSPQQIKERSYVFIKYLRIQKPQTPIIMIESVYRETAYWNSKTKSMVEQQNQEFRNTFDKLHAENPKGIYYIKSAKLMGTDHEATVDGTHLTDLGFMRISETVMKYLKKAL